MLGLDGQTEVYTGTEPIDFRKQIDGVALQVQEALELDAYSTSLFVFRNQEIAALAKELQEKADRKRSGRAADKSKKPSQSEIRCLTHWPVSISL